MSFRVSGKNIDIGDALRGRVNQRIADATAKYFDGGYSGHVTIGKDGFGFRTECVVHLDSGIEKRLRRYKSRLKDHQNTRVVDGHGDQSAFAAQSYVIAAPEQDTDDEIIEFNPVIIAESTTTLKRMSVSDAVMQLDLTGTAVIVFRHAGHGRVNLVYRRADGHIGWIDPPTVEAKDGH